MLRLHGPILVSGSTTAMDHLGAPHGAWVSDANCHTAAMSVPGIMLVADLHGLAGRVAELRALLDELADHSRSEPACVDFRVLSAPEPAEFVLLSTWTDETALRSHYDSAHYRHYRAQVGPLLARPSDVLVHRLSASVHALDPNPPDPETAD
jgi:quinol monooxygenase YgiN